MNHHEVFSPIPPLFEAHQLRQFSQPIVFINDLHRQLQIQLHNHV